MEPEARYAWVGAAVLALAVMMMLGLYWLTGGTDHRPVKRYTVYFQNQSLEGLQINSDVRMQGIDVGQVVDYTIMPGEAGRVRVTLQVDARTPVLEGVQAVVSKHLVTGLAAIDLNNPPGGQIPLAQVPPGEEYPVIPEGVAQLARVANTLEEMSLSSRDALIRLNNLLSDDNQRAVASLLANLDGLSGDLRQAAPELRATLKSARRAAERLDQVGGEAGQTLRDTRQQLNRVAEATEATLRQVDGRLDDLSMQLKLSADLGLQEIQATAQSLRQAGDALQSSGQALANPAKVLYGPRPDELGPGEAP